MVDRNGRTGTSAGRSTAGKSTQQRSLIATFNAMCGPNVGRQLQASVVVQTAIKQQAAKAVRDQAIPMVQAEAAFQLDAFNKALAKTKAWLLLQDLVFLAKNELPLPPSLPQRAAAVRPALQKHWPKLADGLSTALDLLQQIKAAEADLRVLQASMSVRTIATNVFKLNRNKLWYWRSVVPVRERMRQPDGTFPLMPVAVAILPAKKPQVFYTRPLPAFPQATLQGFAFKPGQNFGYYNTKLANLVIANAWPYEYSGDKPQNSNYGWSVQSTTAMADLADRLGGSAWWTSWQGVTVPQQNDVQLPAAYKEALHSWAASQLTADARKGVPTGSLWMISPQDILATRDAWDGADDVTDLSKATGIDSYDGPHIQQQRAAEDAYRQTVLKPKLAEIEKLQLLVHDVAGLFGKPLDVKWQVGANGFWYAAPDTSGQFVEAQAQTKELLFYLGPQPIDPASEIELWFKGQTDPASLNPVALQASKTTFWSKLLTFEPKTLDDFPENFLGGRLGKVKALLRQISRAPTQTPLPELPGWVNDYISLQAQVKACADLATLAANLGSDKTSKLQEAWDDLSNYTMELYGYALPTKPPAGTDLAAFYQQKLMSFATEPAPGSLAALAAKAKADADILAAACAESQGEACAKLAQAQQEADKAAAKVLSRVQTRRGGWSRGLDRAGASGQDVAAAASLINLFAALAGKEVRCTTSDGSSYSAKGTPSAEDQAKIAAAKKAAAETAETTVRFAAGASGSSDANQKTLEKIGAGGGTTAAQGDENKKKADDILPAKSDTGLGAFFALAVAGVVAAKGMR